MFDGGGCGWGCVNGRLSGWKWILVRGYLLFVYHSVSAIANLFALQYSIPWLTLPTLERKAMHQRHITAAFCVLYEYFVSEVSGQDKDRDKESGECRIGVFYLNQGVNGVNQKGNPEISTVLCAIRTILEDTYTGYGGRAGEREPMAVPDLHEILYSTTPFFVSSASV